MRVLSVPQRPFRVGAVRLDVSLVMGFSSFAEELLELLLVYTRLGHAGLLLEMGLFINEVSTHPECLRYPELIESLLCEGPCSYLLEDELERQPARSRCKLFALEKAAGIPSWHHTCAKASPLEEPTAKEIVVSRAYPQPRTDDHASSWWALVLRGLVAILFGLAALFWPGLILAVLIVFFGAYALVDGVFAIIAAFRSSRGGMRRPLLLIEGVIGILFGLLALFWPGLTALALLYFVALWAILSGIARIAMAILLRRDIENEWSIALSGVLSVILGIVLILLPGAGLLAYTWLIGLLALAVGIALIYYAFRVRGQRTSGSGRVA